MSEDLRAALDKVHAIYQAERAERIDLQRRLDEVTLERFAAVQRAARADGKVERLESEVEYLRRLLGMPTCSLG